MKREFTDESFEYYLQSSADKLRMRAPDKIWKNISKQLNERRRRIVIGLSALLLITSALGYYTITNGWKQDSVTASQTGQQPVTSTINEFVPEYQPSEKEVVAISQKKNSNYVPATIFPDANKIQTISTNQNDIGREQINTQTAGKPLEESSFIPTVVDSYQEFEKEETVAKQFPKTLLTTTDVLPLTIESVLNSFKLRLRKKKIETQFYFTPTISYRKLSENKSYLRSINPSNASANYRALYSSVNNEVTHKPDVGFELGVTTKYPLSKKLTLRTGLQFNVNRYDVKAFSSYLSDVTIALNNGSRLDSLNTSSTYSNINGYKSNWLQNFSFQISAPVGVEILLGGTDKDQMQFGIAGTIQPTYVLGDRAYLISTDYKNYALVPSLARRWNVNTAFETFVMYKTGKTKWQVGPQVRYQLLSSFIDKYPVKENLFDFGLKIGLSLNK